ncbi:putative transmembrane protein [Apostichopus japonicus]|uniref:Putative transmembrane protein n=1 Tax=Stichopus japonicus TaxID=307972 RepID=A0A2G8LNJ9_STIJA|nr:putative transmembrane protein [Apostichopus japonicus]
MSSFKNDVTKAVYTVKDEVGGAMTSVKDGVGKTVTTVTDEVGKAVDSVRLWTWRQWIRPLFVILYSLFVCIAFPILIWDMYYHEAYLQAFSWLTTGLCALIAIGVSGYGILSHIVYFTRPNQQRYIIRILLMVPIYSIDSSIALRVPPAAIFLDSIRACYQAFVVYCFLFYLLHYLSEHYDLDVHLASKPQMKSPKPFCCFKPGPNSKLVYRCRNGVLNFVIIGPLTTVTAILFYYLGDGYETGNFTTTGAWFWLTLISAISQINFCIGIEMAIVSVVHLYAYSHKPYKDAGEPLTFRLSCRRICDYSDMKDDIRVHSGRFIQSIKKRSKGKDKEDKEETYQDGDTAMKVISMKDSTDEEMETSSGSEGPDDPGQATGYSNDESAMNKMEEPSKILV